MSTTTELLTPVLPYDVNRVREDFPILRQTVHGKPLVYLDNAATTQKPQAVIDAISHYYSRDNANVHRGVHLLSERATAQYEAARETVRQFINARSVKEIIYVRGVTEGINLVAQTFGRKNVGEGDEILITSLEHHSNIVPWQMLCAEKGARLRVVPVTDSGEVLFEEYAKLLNEKTKLVAIVHISNALGTVNPVAAMIAAAHERGIPVLVDGAQAAPHLSIDVHELDADFYVFSGHKVFAPTGIGVLYGKERLLEDMPPWQGGGDMILSVSFEKTTYNALPFKFEAGTPNIEGAIALAVALEYVNAIGRENIRTYELDLLKYTSSRLQEFPEVRLIGTAPEKASVVSFVIEGIHPHDIGTIVDQQGVAIRTGHHCAQPLMMRLKVPATARASLALYNTREDIDSLAVAIHEVLEVFG